MRFSMLYSGEQILSFKSCLVFYAGDSLNLVQVEQYTKSNHEVHGSVPFSHRLGVKRGRQYMYSTTIFPLKTNISEKTKSRDTN